MPIHFNPFNPMSYFNAMKTAATNTELALPKVAKGTAIPVAVKSDDAGIKVAKKSVGGQVEVSFSGTARARRCTSPTSTTAPSLRPAR